MTVKIHQFTNSFSHVASIVVTLNNTTSMSISHFASSTKATEATIDFTFEGTAKHVPYIEDEEFCIVVRKKVNMTAMGPNERAITDVGEDVGAYKYMDSVPTMPCELPPGFKEFYK